MKNINHCLFKLSLAFYVLTFLAIPYSKAVTINNTNFQNEVLSGDIAGIVGIWYSQGGKGWTYTEGTKSTNVALSSMNLNGGGFGTVARPTYMNLNYMASLSNYSGPLTNATINYYGSNNELLLALNYRDSGALTTIPKVGYSGEFDITGYFNVVGGTYFTQGIVTGPLYAVFNWASGYAFGSGDFHARDGSFTLYSNQSTGGNTAVPEPATATLMTFGLAALAKKRKKVIAC